VENAAMKVLLILSVGLLSFANGANDNFKGVATLWGAGLATYRRAIAWATGFTILGSLAAIWLGSGLAAKFNGATLLPNTISGQLPFLAAVALGAGATVLLAAGLGLPISTTHSLTGALVGAAVSAAGFSEAMIADWTKGLILPLLFSPVIALTWTAGLQVLATRFKGHTGTRECICIDESKRLAIATVPAMFSSVTVPASMRWAPAAECDTGEEIVRLDIVRGTHWLSCAAISFARGLNDTPKIAAVLFVATVAAVKLDYLFAALAIAAGGVLAATRVARTISKKITPMAPSEAVTANLVSAALIMLASSFALPVSATHITSGSIFGIGLLRRHEADWGKVREIVLSWIATLPLAAALGLMSYQLLARWRF
jgi:inorganic phosphate transporter, PiT family